MAKTRKCLACRTEYSYCPDCSRADALKESWYAEFCSSTCKDLWLTLTRYNMSRLAKTEAKSIISELDLKPIDSYVDCVQRDYAKIMEEAKKQKRGKRVDIKPIDEVIDFPKEIVESVIEESIEPKLEITEPAVEAVHVVVLEEKE